MLKSSGWAYILYPEEGAGSRTDTGDNRAVKPGLVSHEANSFAEVSFRHVVVEVEERVNMNDDGKKLDWTRGELRGLESFTLSVFRLLWSPFLESGFVKNHVHQALPDWTLAPVNELGISDIRSIWSQPDE